MSATALLMRRIATVLASVCVIAIATAAPAFAQCPNNCTGHGTCAPSPETRRFECQCYDGWTGSACSRRESKSAKAKDKEPEIIVDVPEEQPHKPSRKGRPMAGVRPFEQVAGSHWGQLRPRERALLEDLGWEKATWEAKKSPRTIWPQAMQLPFDGLNAKEQAAVLGLGLTAYDWNGGKHLQILMQMGV